MHDAHFLSQIAVLFGTAVVVSWVFRLAKAPSIIGFLVTGMFIGPFSWGLIDEHAVHQFSEIGLVLLLFTIGLELSPAPLMRMGKRVLITMVTLGATVIVLTLVVLMFSTTMNFMANLIIGISLSLSSTAIALKQLSDRGEVQSIMGNIITGVLLLQDVFVILVMMLLPILVGGNAEGDHGHGGGGGPLFVLSMFGALVVIVLVARKLLPIVISQLMEHGGRELITLFAVMMACGGAYLAELAGWPPALGACIAGLLLANADIRHQLVTEITPFRDVFNAIFFIALGMLVNIEAMLADFVWIALAVLATLVLKTFITIGAVKLAGWPLRIGIQAGIGLCTVSEFGYVLAREANAGGLVPDAFLDSLVGYTVGTMMLGAMLFPLGGKLAGRVMVILNEKDLSQLAQGETEDSEELETEDCLTGHVIVAGFGITGENLVQVLKSTHIPHCVIEMNHSMISRAREMGANVIVGDATRTIILEHAGIKRARAIVVGVNTLEDTKRIVSHARNMKPDIYIAARTYNFRDLEPLANQGANMIVPADFEASVKIFSHVLEEFDVPRNVLGSQIAAVRAGGYGMFRGQSSGTDETMEDLLKVLQLTSTQTFYLPKGSKAVGKSIAEVDLRNQTGASIIAIVRDRKPVTNPTSDFVFKTSDVVVMVGAHQELKKARKLMEASQHLDASKMKIDRT